MTSKRLLGASLSLATMLTQVACSAESAATPVPETSGTTTKAPSAESKSTVILPEGTPLIVRTSSAVSINSNESGKTFSAVLEQPVLQDSREIASKGARVEGKIVEMDKGARVLQLTGLEIGGQFIYISTNSAIPAEIAVIPTESVLNFELSAAVTVAAAQVGSKPR